MSRSLAPLAAPPPDHLPRNVKVLGLASLLNDTASEMIYPLLPHFLLLGRPVDEFGPRPFMFFGWLVFAGIYLAFALATATWQVWAFFLGYGLVIGLIEPAERTLVANLVGGERKGLAYGWYNCAVGIATLPSSLIFGALYQLFGALAAFGGGAALALVAALLLTGVRASS
jgi:MFS family permease